MATRFASSPVLQALVLSLAVLLSMRTGAHAAEPGAASYLAEKNGAALVISGVNHGGALQPPSAKLQDYFKNSTVVMSEMDITDPARHATATAEFRHGKALAVRNFVSPEELGVVHAAWMKKLKGKAAMTASTLGELHACGISMFLLPAGGPPPAGATLPRTSPWERVFLPEAKRSGKPIVELEPEGSLRVCGQLAPDQVRALVLEPARLGLDDNARQHYLQQIEASRRSLASGDDAASHAAMQNAIGFNEQYKLAMTRYMGIRNKTMVAVMEAQHAKLAPSSHGFVMLGALHVHGADGILALLREKGFRIARL